MARGEIKLKKKPRQQTRAMGKLQSQKPQLEKPKAKKIEEEVQADQEENFIIPNDLRVDDNDLDLFTKLQEDLKKTKRDVSVAQKLKTQAYETIKQNPAQDPEVKAVYTKYDNKDRGNLKDIQIRQASYLVPRNTVARSLEGAARPHRAYAMDFACIL